MKQYEQCGPAVARIGNTHNAEHGSNCEVPAALAFWEVDSMFSCPLVGACLTLAEQKRLLKKTSMSCKGKSPYELHEIFVTMSSRPNSLSRRVDKFLRRKYLVCIEPMLGLAENDFIRAWNKEFDTGDPGAAVYAVAVNGNLSAGARRELFGRIHMNMHETASAGARLRRELGQARDRTRSVKDKYDELAVAHRMLKKENRSLRKELESRKVELARLNSASDEQPSLKARQIQIAGPSGDGLGSPTRQNVEPEAGDLRRRLELQERKNQKLEEKLARAEEQHRAVLEGVEALMRQAPAGQDCDVNCPSYDLCSKRILMVGGITKMASHYRRMVESQGGRFEYHDGNMKSGERSLENRFRRADLVLCPVDCNSHAACSAVKKLGKKHNKPVRMLFGSSINAVSQALLPDRAEFSNICTAPARAVDNACQQNLK